MHKTKKGFTLIELLVVIAIVGLLSTVVFASLSSARARSRDSKRTQDLVQLRNALELYALNNNGSYPVTSSRFTSKGYLADGASAPCGSDSKWLDGSNEQADFVNAITPYLAQLPEDPDSTRCYSYDSNGVAAAIWAEYETTPNGGPGSNKVAGYNLGADASFTAEVPSGYTFVDISTGANVSGGGGNNQAVCTGSFRPCSIFNIDTGGCSQEESPYDWTDCSDSRVYVSGGQCVEMVDGIEYNGNIQYSPEERGTTCTLEYQ